MCAIDSCEVAVIYDETERRAAKSHVCDDCGRTIDKGERYHLARGLTDGYWWGAKCCAHCYAAGWWLKEICGGWLWQGIGEELAQHWEEGYTDLVVGRLVVGHRRKWKRWDGALMPLPLLRKVIWSASKSNYNRHLLGYEQAS
jgi:hypothetical protein